MRDGIADRCVVRDFFSLRTLPGAVGVRKLLTPDMATNVRTFKGLILGCPCEPA